MELRGRKVVVVGLGKSGLAAARLCLARGAQVVGNDSRSRDQLPADVLALEGQMELVLGSHDLQWEGVAHVVVSPGVPPLEQLRAAASRGTEVIGELELAWRFLPKNIPVAAIGGTNGKSTTTMLVGDMLHGSGISSFVGGNLGTPLSAVLLGGVEGLPDVESLQAIVAEVSSFQVERVPTFRPRVSVLLNISEDHLDRYPSFEAYAHAKGNAFAQQQPGDVAVVPWGDEATAGQARRGQGRLLSFGVAPEADYRVEGRAVIEAETRQRFSLAEAELHGRHNLTNAAAAIAAARQLGATPEGIACGLERFRGLPHRMAKAGDVGGVAFYDDSKATNVGAAVTALLGLTQERAVLIAGGRDKHGSYEPLVAALRQKGRGLVLIGEAADRIAAAVTSALPDLPLSRAKSMPDAVRTAQRLARPGDAVLLSPACSSFDMFTSYADRGEHFAAAVRQLG